MISKSMRRMMSYTVSTKRRPAATSAGKQGAPVAYLASLKTTPIDPLNIDEFHNIVIRYKIEAPERLYGCYTETTADVQVGDIIVHNGREYTLKGVGTWYDGVENLYEMILQELVNV